MSLNLREEEPLLDFEFIGAEMDDPVFQRVRDFIAKQLGEKKHKLTRATRILDDLGCTGDDAYELMEAFFSEFSIDPKNFVFLKYFEPEVVDFIGLTALMMKIYGIKVPSDKRFLTLGDLADSIEKGEWDENCGELRKKVK